MSPRDMIARKRSGQRLSAADCVAWADGMASGSWTDAQGAAMLMAVAIRGMDVEETGRLVSAMTESGRRIPEAVYDRPAVDKHSTGGVGDKASLIVAPLAAACGVAVPMLSGRGLGHTGGTLDKLEAIPGFRVELTSEEMVSVVNKVGCVISGASREVAPADAVLYGLRDQTATVDSIPLICGSILSKKLAEGIGGLVLDVKTGCGAVFPELEQSRSLAHALVESAAAGLPATALVTEMSRPLGRSVGAALEVVEAIECMKGEVRGDLLDLSVRLVAEMLVVAGQEADLEAAVLLAEAKLLAGDALERFVGMVEAQGGDACVVERPEVMGVSRFSERVRAEHGGHVVELDALKLGLAAAEVLGGGPGGEGKGARSAGLVLHVSAGDEVSAGTELLTIYGDDERRLAQAVTHARAAVSIGDPLDVPTRLVVDRIDGSTSGELQP